VKSVIEENLERLVELENKVKKELKALLVMLEEMVYQVEKEKWERMVMKEFLVAKVLWVPREDMILL
jgi:hypothetical protein